jgi:hypothetical protein
MKSWPLSEAGLRAMYAGGKGNAADRWPAT